MPVKPATNHVNDDSKIYILNSTISNPRGNKMKGDINVKSNFDSNMHSMR